MRLKVNQYKDNKTKQNLKTIKKEKEMIAQIIQIQLALKMKAGNYRDLLSLLGTWPSKPTGT